MKKIPVFRAPATIKRERVYISISRKKGGKREHFKLPSRTNSSSGGSSRAEKMEKRGSKVIRDMILVLVRERERGTKVFFFNTTDTFPEFFSERERQKRRAKRGAGMTLSSSSCAKELPFHI